VNSGGEHRPGIAQTVGNTHPPLQQGDTLWRHKSKNESILTINPH